MEHQRIQVFFRDGLRARFILIAGIRQQARNGHATLAKMKWTVLTNGIAKHGYITMINPCAWV
ncbi:hypothetical protein DWH41_17540 [Escherichia coli]|nr:hypothetical protein [Escherichia coli]